MLNLKCECCGKTFQSERRSKRFCSRSCANKYAADNRAGEIQNKEAKIVWSCGGGVQSTAIAVLIWQGKLPKPDYAFMADCGFESARTITYVEEWIRPKLAEVGVEFNRVDSSMYVDVSLMDKSGHCNIPAFKKNPDGSVSKLSTRCNGTWKQSVLRQWLRDHGVEKCVDWVGISTDEARRSNRDTGRKWIENEYPLIRLGLSRKDCVQIIKDAGWEMPLRTSCIMCPLRTKFEWLRLSVDCPEDFKRACVLEQEIQSIDPTIWLTNECRPLSEVIHGE